MLFRADIRPFDFTPVCELIWVSGYECCTVSYYREREKHTRTYTRSRNVSVGLAEKLKPKHDLL